MKFGGWGGSSRFLHCFVEDTTAPKTSWKVKAIHTHMLRRRTSLTRYCKVYTWEHVISTDRCVHLDEPTNRHRAAMPWSLLTTIPVFIDQCHGLSSRQYPCSLMSQLDGVSEVLELPQPGRAPRQHGHRRRGDGLGGAAAAAPGLPTYDGRDADGLGRSGGLPSSHGEKSQPREGGKESGSPQTRASGGKGRERGGRRGGQDSSERGSSMELGQFLRLARCQM